ncbi:hypothetical protein RQP46_006847 [Phenoliferia psychrophenolica]
MAATPHEQEAVLARLRALKNRVLSRPDTSPSTAISHHLPPSSLPDAGDPAAVSRRALRLFAAIYLATNAYENLILGLILRRKPFTQFLRDLRSLSAFRLAAFVASYSATYRILFHQLRTRLPSAQSSNVPPSTRTSYRPSLSKLARRLRTSPYLPPFLAAVLAAPTMLIESSGQRRVTMALYVLTRAIQGAWDAAARKGVVPRAMREGRWWFGGHLLFACVFLFSVDGITTAALQRYPRYVAPVLHPDLSQVYDPTRTLPLLVPIFAETHPGHENLTCAFLHPAEISCWTVFESGVLDEVKGAAKFFGALSILGAGVRWQKFLKDPESGIYRAVLSTITSSTFLSLSIGTAWATICLFQSYLPSAFLPTKRFYMQGFIAGLWVALVDVGLNGAGRATDLGVYSARLALQVCWDVWVKQGKVKNIRNGDVLYFGLSMGVLLSIFEVSLLQRDSQHLRPRDAAEDRWGIDSRPG